MAACLSASVRLFLSSSVKIGEYTLAVILPFLIITGSSYISFFTAVFLSLLSIKICDVPE